jgi:elongator complex protein 2
MVRLYETTNWTQVAELTSHSTTVVAMSFSHNDKYLLTASRDRHFTVFNFESSSEITPIVKSIARVQAHARIIWSVDWTPDDRFFATGARDKLVKIWSMDGSNNVVQLHATLPPFSSPVTALAFAPLSTSEQGKEYLLVVGCEDGRLHLWHSTATQDEYGIQAKSWKCIHQFDDRICHAVTVKRCTWRKSDSVKSSLTLATCGEDHTVRIFEIEPTGLC